MFFREKRNKNSKFPVLQLTQSVRVNGEPRQKIVISLGSELPIPKELRTQVARAVTEKLRGQEYLFTTPKVEEYAENIVLRIQQKGETGFIEARNEKEDIDAVFTNQVKHTTDRMA